MASSKEYVDFILEQGGGLTERAMMGEFVLYNGGKVVEADAFLCDSNSQLLAGIPGE